VSVPDSFRPADSTRSISRDLPTPMRALAIGAHPDDVEFGCGATLAKWASQGCEIFHLVCTDGSKGTWDPSADPADLIATRQREQRAAARVLGSRSDDHVIFLGWPDGELESGLRQRWEIAYWIRHTRPDVVLAHDPWRPYRLHPDHRNAGFLACDGIVAARDPKFFPEQRIAPHRPTSLLLWEAPAPNHLESVAEHIDTKVAALLAHTSQFESTMKIRGTAATDEIARFTARVTERAQEAGRLAGQTASEAFMLMTDL
jgi:LmbE family N-acetylglucosaminyl deacetylase